MGGAVGSAAPAQQQLGSGEETAERGAASATATGGTPSRCPGQRSTAAAARRMVGAVNA